ncbi:unnamed protein product [Didymodactylos carnosus]|nr:unnamed protein product [Didymodactylos carnosus]
MYGGPGNLSDGSSGLAFGFGPKIKDGDKIGLLLDLNNNDLKLHIFHNDQSIGTAFHLQGSYPTPLFPVVHFDGDGEMTIRKLNKIPTELKRNQANFTGIEGDWKMKDKFEKLSDGCNWKNYTFNIESAANDGRKDIYRLSVGICNRLWSEITKESDGTWKIGGIMSTRKGGQPEEMTAEHTVGEFLRHLKNIDLDSVGCLILKTDNYEQMVLQRYSKDVPKPVTQNIFDAGY